MLVTLAGRWGPQWVHTVTSSHHSAVGAASQSGKQQKQLRAHPSSNTGALSTFQAGEGVPALFDWLSLTLAEDDGTPGAFLPGADDWEWVEQKGGVNGYRREKRCGSLRFFYEGGVPGMGVHLLLTGQGCREVEARMAAPALPDERQSCPKVGPPLASDTPFDWQGWATYLVGRGVHCTRLDLALDDRRGILNLTTIAETIARGDLTRESIGDPAYHGTITPGGMRLETIYLGNARSETRVCIYDKAVEQGEEGHWLRVEVRWRRERAQGALALFACGGVAPLLGVLRRAVAFRERTNDTNKSRWPIAKWWRELLGAVNPISLSVAPRMRTLADTYLWLRDYIAPSLALMVKWQGRGTPVWNLVRSGMRRLSPAQLALLAGAEGSLALSAT